MTIEEVTALVQGEIVAGAEYGDRLVKTVIASDLMSDVLTVRDHDNLLLMTGLCNMQSIRTCEMSDIEMLLVVRGKVVTPEMIELAEDNDMVVITTKLSMFKTAGLLYEAGLASIY